LSNLPSNISLPQWAYLNASDSFNVTAAQAATETSGTPSAIPSKRYARRSCSRWSSRLGCHHRRPMFDPSQTLVSNLTI
ncbi:hypothetical protein CONPUDRAFT_79808, partial [Coniophora puteana RWD-64-598 SS2]